MSTTPELTPIGGKVVLEVEEQETTTAGGIVLPGAALDKPFKGVVVAANAQYTMPDGSKKDGECQVGDTVYFGKSHGSAIKHGDREYLVIDEDLILAKVSHDN